MFHASLLTPYHETSEHGPNYIKPPPELINNQEEYEIDTILAHKQKGKQRLYLIKWKGYGSNENTWEPEENLENSNETLKEYKRQHNINNKLFRKPKRKLLSPSSRKHITK